MKTNIAIITLILWAVVSQSCTKMGTCELPEHVRFRGVSFSFPIRAAQVIEFSKVKYAKGDFVITDSILPSSSAQWFMESQDSGFETDDSARFVNDALIYATSFLLYGDVNKSDTEILDELRKNYDGAFIHKKVADTEYYINWQKCLTVIFKRDLYDIGSVPVVSFCYGFSEEEGNVFGRSTGHYLFAD